MILDMQYDLCKSYRDWVLFCWVKCMALRNGKWIDLKYDMILGGIFNIWRYLTYSPPLRPCTAGLDVAKTRRLGVTCSRINSSSGNYGITSSTPQPKTLIPTQRLPKSVNTSKMWISTSVLPNFKVYFLFSLLSSVAYTFAACHSIVSELLWKFFHIFLWLFSLVRWFSHYKKYIFERNFSPGECTPINPYIIPKFVSNLWFKTSQNV